MSVKVLTLGAGQDIGKSCIIVTLGGRRIMFDCGMHMGYSDERRFPDWRQLGIAPGARATGVIDCVVISHFHMDHIGALPYLTEVLGYDGPIYMTQPTLAIAPILLKDYLAIVERERPPPPSERERPPPPSQPAHAFHPPQARSPHQAYQPPSTSPSMQQQQPQRGRSTFFGAHGPGGGGGDSGGGGPSSISGLPPQTAREAARKAMYTASDIDACLRKVTPIALGATVQVDDALSLVTHYAGHVLGAVMVAAECLGQRILYTGDFNMTADRHLGSARPPARLAPHVLISEATYATSIRESKRCREADLLQLVHCAMDEGGRVLIPVGAIGRAQELLMLFDSYWSRMGLRAPLYLQTVRSATPIPTAHHSTYQRHPLENAHAVTSGHPPELDPVGRITHRA